MPDIPEAFTYEGTELLVLSEQLVNYNKVIANLVAAHVRSGDRVLDFGAGVGTLTRVVAKRIGKMECVEIDSRQRAVLEQQGFHCYPSLEDVPRESFDVVYSSNVLEHIFDDVDALRRLRMALRPGGRIVLYVPAFQSLYTAMDAAIGHHRRYDVPTLRTRMIEAGFDVREAYYVDLIGYVISWIFKRVSNNVDAVNATTLKIYDTFVFPLSRVLERLRKPLFGKNVFAVGTRSAD